MRIDVYDASDLPQEEKLTDQLKMEPNNNMNLLEFQDQSGTLKAIILEANDFPKVIN